MSAKSARLAGFKRYAANLSLCFPDVIDTFLCPLCKRDFGPDALDEPPRIVLAHCIPQSLGGGMKTMACAECDNKGGAYIDVHLKDRLETEDFFQGTNKTSQRVWLNIAGNQVRAKLTLTCADDGSPSFIIATDEKRSPREEYVLAGNALSVESSNPQGLQCHVEGDPLPWNGPMSRIAMLRSAYLIMFRHFGYSYILHGNVDCVRQQIQCPEQAILPPHYCLVLPEDDVHANTVAIVTSPPEYRSFIVRMRFKTASERCVYRGVIMPGLDKDGFDVYERLHNQHLRGERFCAQYTVIQYEPNRLATRESVALPYVIWRSA